MTDTRHRLIKANGAGVWYVWGLVGALDAARECFAKTGVSVLVCEAPEGGIVREVELVGGTKQTLRRRP